VVLIDSGPLTFLWTLRVGTTAGTRCRTQPGGGIASFCPHFRPRGFFPFCCNFLYSGVSALHEAHSFWPSTSGFHPGRYIPSTPLSSFFLFCSTWSRTRFDFSQPEPCYPPDHLFSFSSIEYVMALWPSESVGSL